MPLLTYADLAAESPKGGTYAERAVIRMKDTATPMPPLPAAPVLAADIAAFESWVAGGLPEGDCEGVGGGAPSPYDTPEVCTSMTTWTQGDHESPDMHPGMACIQCHTDEKEGPALYVGGTVYPSAHEPDDCNGSNGVDGTVVEITDATMKVVQIPVRKSGNFFWQTTKGKITMPIKARVLRGDQVRAMADAVPTGDCNTCHTLEGSGMPQAPGRIMAP